MIDIVIAFFALGIIASVVKSRFEFPAGLYQTLSIFLMLAIGLKGGIALADHSSPSVAGQALVVIAFGLMLPFIAYPLLRFFGGLPRQDCASIAAHYGSVSVGTYAVAVAVLESRGIAYEAYFPLFVVLLEVPAIAVGIVMADRSLLAKSRKLVHEVVTSQGILLMSGGLLIGFIYGEHAASIKPFFQDLFHGVLALFLLNMGMIAGKKLGELKNSSVFILSFGVLMPLIGAILGGLTGSLIGLSTGGVILLSVLGASASYIAVPAAMLEALPKANHSLSITSSLAITFPFNVVVGIPVYVSLVQWLS